MNTKGIDMYFDGRFRVRVMRDGVRYDVGWSHSLEDAIRIRDEWLAEYANRRNFDKYSKRWFQEERAKQMEEFKKRYAADRKSGRSTPRMVFVERSMPLFEEHTEFYQENVRF